MAAAEDLDGNWPVSGTVLQGSTRRTLLLSETSPLFHEGMTLQLRVPRAVLADEDNNDVDAAEGDPDNDFVIVEATVSGVDLVNGSIDIKSTLSFDPVDAEFMLLERVPPDDANAWTALDCACLIWNLSANLATETDAKGNPAKSLAWCCGKLGVADVPLTPDSTVDELRAAWKSTVAWLHRLDVRATQLGVIGKRNSRQMERFTTLHNVIGVYTTIFEHLLSHKTMSDAMSMGMAQPGAMADIVGRYQYSVNNKQDNGNEGTQLLKVLLYEAQRLNYRHKGDVIYKQVFTDCVKWTPPDGNPACEKCGAPAAFGPPPALGAVHGKRADHERSHGHGHDHSHGHGHSHSQGHNKRLRRNSSAEEAVEDGAERGEGDGADLEEAAEAAEAEADAAAKKANIAARVRCSWHRAAGDVDLRPRTRQPNQIAAAKCLALGGKGGKECGRDAAYGTATVVTAMYCSQHSPAPGPGMPAVTLLTCGERTGHNCQYPNCSAAAVCGIREPRTRRKATHCRRHATVVCDVGYCDVCYGALDDSGTHRELVESMQKDPAAAALDEYVCESCNAAPALWFSQYQEVLLDEHPDDVADLELHPDEARVLRCATGAFVPLMGDNGKPMTISEWIHDVFDPTIRPVLWIMFTNKYLHHLETLSKYLLRSRHAAFPEVLPDRALFAFRNGVYDIVNNKFAEYGPGNPYAGKCVVNYVNGVIHDRWLRDDPSTIAVPGYDDMLASQDYGPDMRHWMDTVLGRLFFPLGKYDKWDKIPFIKGFAATGKSTIVKMLAKLYGESNVGYIDSNCEEKYPVAHLVGKFMWACLEVKAQFRLPTNVLQSMITGENVVVAEKFKTAFAMLWDIAGLMVGNELPQAFMSDVGNALQRRFLMLAFDIQPATQDPTVATRFEESLAPFFVRIVRTYMREASLGTRDKVDKRLPQKMLNAIHEFQYVCQPLLAFLRSKQDEMERATPELMMVIKHELFITQGKPGAQMFGIHAPELRDIKERIKQVRRDLMGAEPDKPWSPKALLDEWRIDMDTLQAAFRSWCHQSGIRPPGVHLKETYIPACLQEKLIVLDNVAGAEKMWKKLSFYGIKFSGPRGGVGMAGGASAAGAASGGGGGGGGGFAGSQGGA